MELCWSFMSDLFCRFIPSNRRFHWPRKISQWHEDPEIIKFLYIFFKLADWEGRDTFSISTETGDIIHLVWGGGYCQSAPVHWFDIAQISNWRGGAGAMGKSWDVSIRKHKRVSGFTGWGWRSLRTWWNLRYCAIMASKNRELCLLHTMEVWGYRTNLFASWFVLILLAIIVIQCKVEAIALSLHFFVNLNCSILSQIHVLIT